MTSMATARLAAERRQRARRARPVRSQTKGKLARSRLKIVRGPCATSGWREGSRPRGCAWASWVSRPRRPRHRRKERAFGLLAASGCCFGSSAMPAAALQLFKRELARRSRECTVRTNRVAATLADMAEHVRRWRASSDEARQLERRGARQLRRESRDAVRHRPRARGTGGIGRVLGWGLRAGARELYEEAASRSSRSRACSRRLADGRDHGGRRRRVATGDLAAATRLLAPSPAPA